MSDKKDNPWIQVARYMSFAVLLPVSTLIGYGIGYELDRLFSTNFLKMVFLALGAAGGFIQLIRGTSRE